MKLSKILWNKWKEGAFQARKLPTWFKPGNLVRCLVSGNYSKKGKTYKVGSQIIPSSYQLCDTNNNRISFSTFNFRFQKVDN